LDGKSKKRTQRHSQLKKLKKPLLLWLGQIKHLKKPRRFGYMPPWELKKLKELG